MGNFKKFLMESEATLQDIIAALQDLNDEEIDAFGVYLYDEFFSMVDGEQTSVSDMYFDADAVISMIKELGEDMYDEVYDLISAEEYEDEENDAEDMAQFDNSIDYGVDSDAVKESVKSTMSVKNINRKKRKFFSKSKAQLRKEAPQRKIEMRKTFTKRREYMRANASKIAHYQQSRKAFIKQGAHFVKLRKKSGMATSASGPAK